MSTKENLDKRICDCEEGAINEQTYREFLLEAEIMIFGEVTAKSLNQRLENMTTEQIDDYIEELDYLLEK